MVQTKARIENDAIKILAEEIRNEIDGDILRECLLHGGWTQVTYKYYDNMKEAVDIRNWLDENIKDDKLWKRFGEYFLFRNKEDAEWFALRWL